MAHHSGNFENSEFFLIFDKSHVEDIIVVSDEEIVNAMYLIWERMKLVCYISRGQCCWTSVLDSTISFRQIITPHLPDTQHSTRTSHLSPLIYHSIYLILSSLSPYALS